MYSYKNTIESPVCNTRMGNGELLIRGTPGNRQNPVGSYAVLILPYAAFPSAVNGSSPISFAMFGV